MGLPESEQDFTDGMLRNELAASVHALKAWVAELEEEIERLKAIVTDRTIAYDLASKRADAAEADVASTISPECYDSLDAKRLDAEAERDEAMGKLSVLESAKLTWSCCGCDTCRVIRASLEAPGEKKCCRECALSVNGYEDEICRGCEDGAHFTPRNDTPQKQDTECSRCEGKNGEHAVWCRDHDAKQDSAPLPVLEAPMIFSPKMDSAGDVEGE